MVVMMKDDYKKKQPIFFKKVILPISFIKLINHLFYSLRQEKNFPDVMVGKKGIMWEINVWCLSFNFTCKLDNHIASNCGKG